MQVKHPDMAKLFPLKRMTLILNRLRDGRSASPKELAEYVASRAGILDDRMGTVSLRTIQRDIRTIGELFRIDIECNSSREYQIVSRSDKSDDYESLLMNFELLSSLDSDITLQKYVLSEHRRPAFSINIPDLLYAIRECHPVEFDYTLVRHGGKVVTRKIKPHFLKESQQRWYLIGYDSDSVLKTFGLDRMRSVSVAADEKFVRDDAVDVPSLFRESFGIWNNPSDPVEEIVLKYDALDGAFVKTLPLHSSQEILSDTSDGITVRLRLRITNDFVMALLSRSRSVEVVSPLHLRQRLHNIWSEALKRNR